VVVVGGGFGGLGAALSLARRGHEVVLLERDHVDQPTSADDAFRIERPGATQVHQTHGFLARIVVLMRERFPDLLDGLLAAGCSTMSGTSALGEPRPGDEDLSILLVRRSTFEWVLRRAVANEPGIEVRPAAPVAGLSSSSRPATGPPAVEGVVLENGEEIRAAVVVAATGRRGDVPAWLATVGVEVPEVERPSGLMYLTRWYRADDAIATPLAPKAGGDLEFLKYLVVPGDGGMLSATLAIPTEDRELRRTLSDPNSFDRACRKLPGPDEWFGELELTPVGGVRPMGGLVNRIRTFTDADGEPSVLNFHALGDAHTCTNPLYGRGCSLALVQATLLTDALETNDEPSARGAQYEAACREQVAPWWRHAVELDRSGADPNHDAPDHEYRERMAALLAASQNDPVVGRAMGRLWNLLALPSELDADPEFVMRAAAIMGDPETYPAPERPGLTREILLDALAAEETR
jgi:2-polyprenyl-6-methoxyphenol hydroxylase-like FAD-dependent oxidoreductase